MSETNDRELSLSELMGSEDMEEATRQAQQAQLNDSTRQQEPLRAAEAVANEESPIDRNQDAAKSGHFEDLLTLSGDTKQQKRSLVTAFADVEYTPPDFLINPYIPLGKITILQGDPSAGKTAVACSLAAHISTGTPLCGYECKRRPVLLLSYEDDTSTLKGRLEANGADVSSVFYADREKLEQLRQDGEGSMITFADPRIEEMIRDTKAGLVIFDPLQLFLGADMDMNQSNQTRPILDHLVGVAERNNCAVVIISHLNKNSKGKALHRSLGSMDIPAIARSVIHIGRVPDNKDKRAAIHVKSNMAAEGQSLEFDIGDRGRVTWRGISPLAYEDLERAASRKQDNGIPYEDEPLVSAIRHLIAENPGGVFVTYQELYDYAFELLSYPPASSKGDIGKKAQELQREARLKDHILITVKKDRPKAFMRFGKPAGGSGNSTQGVLIRQYTPQPEACQTQLMGYDEGM